VGVKSPGSTKYSLSQRLWAREREAVAEPVSGDGQVPGGVAYVDRASDGDFESRSCPPGVMGGSAEEALDCACGLYVGNPSAWAFSGSRSRRGRQGWGHGVVVGDALEHLGSVSPLVGRH
jgi:hypothetical protein